MRLPKKIEDKVKNITQRILMKTTKVTYAEAENITKKYIKFLRFLGDFIQISAFGFVFFYLMPKVFHIEWNRIIAIMLFLILLQLRFSKTKITT